MLKKILFILVVLLFVLAGCSNGVDPDHGKKTDNTGKVTDDDQSDDVFGDDDDDVIVPDDDVVVDDDCTTDDDDDVVVDDDCTGDDDDDAIDYPEYLMHIGYVPTLNDKTGDCLEEYGFTDVRFADLRRNGWIELSPPGGLAGITTLRTPEFDSLSRNTGFGLDLRYKLKFPDEMQIVPTAALESTPLYPIYKDTNKFLSMLYDKNGDIRYALLYTPNVAGTECTPDFYFFFGDPNCPTVRCMPIRTGRLAPVGEIDNYVSIRLVLLPTSCAGGDGEIQLLFDAGDGQGYETYPIVQDSSAVCFSGLGFIYQTGPGVCNSRAILRDLQFRLWRVKYVLDGEDGVNPDDTCDDDVSDDTCDDGDDIGVIPDSMWCKIERALDKLVSDGDIHDYVDAIFDELFPEGIEIGLPGDEGCSTQFTDGLAVLEYLDQENEPAVLKCDSVDPPKDSGNLLSAKVLKLMLKVGYELYKKALGDSCDDIEEMEVPEGTFQGWTVAELLEEANCILGGGESEYTLGDLYEAVTAIVNHLDLCETPDTILEVI